MALLIPVPQQSQLFSRLLVLLIPVLRQLIVVFRCPRLHVAEEGHAARERHPRGHARSVAAPPGRQHYALSGPGPADTPADLPSNPASPTCGVGRVLLHGRPALSRGRAPDRPLRMIPPPADDPRGPAPRPGQQRGCPSGRPAGGGSRGDAA